jgi:hypothetical protein
VPVEVVEPKKLLHPRVKDDEMKMNASKCCSRRRRETRRGMRHMLPKSIPSELLPRGKSESGHALPSEVVDEAEGGTWEIDL